MINAIHLHPNDIALWVENSDYVKEWLNFSNTGIDLRQLSIDSGNFAGIHIIDKDHLKIDKKPEWVTQSVPGYIGFHEQNRQSYTPFNLPNTASCVPQ